MYPPTFLHFGCDEKRHKPGLLAFTDLTFGTFRVLWTLTYLVISDLISRLHGSSPAVLQHLNSLIAIFCALISSLQSRDSAAKLHKVVREDKESIDGLRKTL